ncbi:sigma-70 family RNA polymerase sigma factor [uncultured Draconibacterium sp.]|uniref:RNA polymerase sigma factor n=1 Tax=uncultured Draconibacterium sp. TaxID=1573823 RepID=UPI00321723F0
MIDKNLTNNFLELVEENKKLIYKVSHMYCNSPTERNDLFQEIVTNLWKGFPQFKGLSKFSTWAYRISINTAISWFRDYSNHRNYIEYTDFVPNMTDDCELDELTDTLFNAIEHLGKIDKAIILLQLDGYSYDDIAEIIGISKTNVATKINRLKLKLKSHLSNN